MKGRKFFFNRVLLSFLILFLMGCSGSDKTILPGERENIFVQDICEDCYSDKLNNNKIKVKKVSGENSKLLNGNFSFKKIDSFKIGKVSKRRTGKNFVLTPVVKKNLLFTLDSEFLFKIYSLVENDIVYERKILDKKTVLKNEIPVGFSVDNDPNVVFITTSNGRVVSFDIDKKEILWERILDGKIVKSSPSFSKKYVFVLSSDNVLFAFRKIGGAEVFKHKGLPVLTSFEQGATVVIDDNENIIVPFSNGEIHYLTSRGRFLFASNVKNYGGVKTANLLMDIVEKPVVDKDKLIVAGMANSLKVINLKNAEVLWEKDIKVKYLPVVKYGYVFVQDDAGNVFSFGEDSAKVYWKSVLPKDKEGKNIEWLGPIEDNGKLIFSSEFGDVLILDLKTGKQIFRDYFGKNIFVIKPIVSGESLILINDKGVVKILR